MFYKLLNLSVFVFISSSFAMDKLPQKTEVHMWDQQQVSMGSDEQARKVIFTNGLCGCIALALITKYKSGKRSVVMSHYPPINRSAQISNLRKACLASSEEDAVQGKSLVVLVPGEWAQDSEGKWSIFKAQDSELSHIESLGIAADTSPIVSVYSELRVDENSPDFQVTLDKDGTTWESFGDWHIPHKISE